MTIGRRAGDDGVAGGVGDGAVAHAVVQRNRNARAKALALHVVARGACLFVRVFEVGVPVETVFVEAQEASGFLIVEAILSYRDLN